MSKEVDTIKEKIVKEILSDDFINDIRDEKDKEIERLQEEVTYMTQKAYDFFNALIDIKELVVNNACLDESINKCVDDLIYYKCDELLDIVNKALGVAKSE